MIDNKEVGKNILNRRRLKGISLSELAEKCKVSKGYLSLLENGKTNPTIDVLDKIAKTFDVTIGDLIGQEVVKGDLQPIIKKHFPDLWKFISERKRKKMEIDENIILSLSKLQLRGDSEPDWEILYRFIESSLKNGEKN